MGLLRKLFGDEITTDVLEILAEQHKDVDALFEKLEKREGNRRALFDELADKLAAHATVEEQIFYPFVMSKDTSELLHESVEEHLSIKRVLADLLTMELDDEEFFAKLSVLKEHVSHHAHEEEEAKLFPKVREMFSRDVRAGIGNEVVAMFEDLLPSKPSRSVPAETEIAAPLPAARR